MSTDDAAYRRSVRNMSFVLAAIVITVFAAIFIPPYLFPSHDVFQNSVSRDSGFGFTMHLQVSSTSIPAGGSILVTGWVNSTSSSCCENVTSAQNWGLPQSALWGAVCTSGWPIGVGLMHGHYTQDNYTLGTLIPLPQPETLMPCPVQANTPTYFLFEPNSSKALVAIGGSPSIWNIETVLTFKQDRSGNGLAPGVYTAVLADEWGDVLTTNFRVA